MYLFLDIETTGLPTRKGWDEYYPYTKSSCYDSSRVVQVGLLLCDKNMKKIDEKDMVVRRDGFHIPKSEFHCITNAISEERGIPMSEIGDVLVSMMGRASHLLAHNALFDITILKSEFHRIGKTNVVDALTGIKTICTMKKTAPIVGILSRNGFKSPRLDELYKYAVGKTIQNHHNALGDVQSLHEAITSLLQSGELTLPL